MYVCNMLGETGVGLKKADKLVKFNNTLSDGAVKGIITMSGDVVTMCEGNVGENLFGVGLNEDGDELAFTSVKARVTKSMIKDTDENPVIAVLCSSIAVYSGVPTCLRCMYINDDIILACLLYGACEFNGIPMVRCYNGDIADNVAKRTFTGADVKSFVDSKGKSGYNYINEYMFTTVISFSASKSGESINFRNIPEGCKILNDSILVEREQAYEKKLEKQKLEKEMKIERQKRMMEEYRIAEENRAKERAEENKKKAVSRVAKKKSETTISVGAATFLDMVLNGNS